MLESWKRHAQNLRAETYALYLAYRDPRTPWYARLFAALVVGYAFSPVDLIPDFVPVLGYLDDLVLVSLGGAPGPEDDPARSPGRKPRAGAGSDDRRPTGLPGDPCGSWR